MTSPFLRDGHGSFPSQTAVTVSDDSNCDQKRELCSSPLGLPGELPGYKAVHAKQVGE